MHQYVDTRFGFSFWYPESWTMQHEDRVADPTNSGWYRGGWVLHRLKLTSSRDTGDTWHGIAIDELYVRSGVLTELGHSRDGASPGGAGMHFSLATTPATEPGTPATLSGQPIAYGASSHQAEVVIALDRNHFIVLTTGNPGGNMDHLHLAETVAVRHPDGTWPANPQAEADTIRRSAAKLGVK